MNMLKV